MKNTALKLKEHNLSNQQGVTLLLAVLILSAILAISFSVATILFVEVRTSGDLLRTETALYGAGAITEEALFKIKRGVPQGSFSYTTRLGPVALDNPAPVENVLNDPLQRVVVSPGTTFVQTPNHYVFFDPFAANQTAGSGYGKVVISNLSNNPSDAVTVYLCQFDPAIGYPCDNPSDPTAWLVQGQLLTSSQPAITVDQSGFFDPNKQQELILYNTTNNNISVQIQTYGQAGAYTPLGLPFFGSKSVDINANFGGVGRRLRVLIPNQ